MFAESVSIWASVNSWFTPTTFFVVLNLMIGTIYITSTLSSPAAAADNGGERPRARARPQVAGSPSVLQRLRSASFYASRSEESTTTTVLFADRHQQSLDSSANLDSGFPQFQNPSHGDGVTVQSQRLSYADGSEESAADSHRQSLDSSARLDSGFPQFQNPSHGDDVTIRSRSRSPILQRLNYAADRSEESSTVFADPPRKSLDLTARFDSVFPQSQNPSHGDDVTIQSQSPILQRVDLGDFTSPADSAVAGADSGDATAEIEQEVVKDLGASFEEARGHVSRTKSDTKPNKGDLAPKLARKMKKSASLKSAFSHFREEESSAVESRRPATARPAAPLPEEADEGVDAKADDFINKFKLQLKLQRMDSITRYKEMIGRGSIHK